MFATVLLIHLKYFNFRLYSERLAKTLLQSNVSHSLLNPFVLFPTKGFVSLFEVATFVLITQKQLKKTKLTLLLL